MEGFTLPARTRTYLVASIDMLRPGETVPLELEPGYSLACIDCDYKTTDVGVMLEHQGHQERYHTRWQRFRRWRSIRAGPKEYIGRRRK